MTDGRVTKMVKLAVAPSLKATIGLTGGALAGAVILGDIIDDIGDVVKTKYITQATPTWETSGQSELMNDYGSLYRSTRAKEMLYNMMFDAPESAMTEGSRTIGKGLAGGALTPTGTSADRVVGSLASSPEIKAVGRANARKLMSEVINVAPRATAAAPSIALPIIQTAIDSGSMAMRPEMLKMLTDAESQYRRQFA